MTQKFLYDGYTLCVTFRSENALSITASYNMTGENFFNDMVELGKIKKDTVLATLSRKSQKNLKCIFKMIDENPRKLIISFVVNFDYLPEFSEDVTLEFMEVKGQAFNKISSVELQSQIQEIEKILDSLKENGTISIHQKNCTVSNKSEIWDTELTPGAYILQISGVLTNASQLHDSIQYTLQVQGEEEIKMNCKTNTQHGYGYPFAFTHKLQTKGGKLQITANNKHSNACTLTNHVVSLIPVVLA